VARGLFQSGLVVLVLNTFLREMTVADVWRKCSSCKNPIALGARYYRCSVSTCNSPRTGYAFCSVPCWEVHLPSARHKDAAAIEDKAPMTAAAQPATDGARRIVVGPTPLTREGQSNVP
jgi:hypothetical protein